MANPNTRVSQIDISSSTTKNVPIYNLEVKIAPKSGPTRTIKVSKPFTEWFDEQGRFVTIPFQQMIATGVPLVGKLNPERVVVSGDLPKELLDGSSEVLDAILASSSASAVGSSLAAEAGAKTAAKRRKA